MGGGEIQMMRHMQAPSRTDLRRPGRRRTDERLQGGRARLANHGPAYRHGVAEQPWGRRIFPMPPPANTAHTHPPRANGSTHAQSQQDIWPVASGRDWPRRRMAHRLSMREQTPEHTVAAEAGWPLPKSMCEYGALLYTLSSTTTRQSPVRPTSPTTDSRTPRSTRLPSRHWTLLKATC